MVLNPQAGHVMNQGEVQEDSSEDDIEEDESDDSTVVIYTGPPGRALV